MPNREHYSCTKFDQLLDPATHTSDQNSASVSLFDYDSVTLYALVGESGDSLSGSVKIEFEVEEADDDGSGSPDTWSDVADADLINYVAGTNDGCFAVVDAAAEDDAVYATGYRGNKPHVRVVANFVGSHSSGTPIAIMATRQHGRERVVNTVTTQ